MIGALLALSLLVPIPGQAHADHADHAAHQVTLGASAAFAPDGRLWLVRVDKGRVLAQYSDDLGKAFSAAVPVNAEREDIYASGEYAPKLAIGPGGALYVAWSARATAGWSGNIRLARSLDGGASFEPPVTVNHVRTPAMRGFLSMAVAQGGRLVIAWIDSEYEVDANPEPPNGFALYGTWSNDRGHSFVAERKWVERSCECCRTVMKERADGSLVAFLRGIYGDNIRDHTLLAIGAEGPAGSPQRATFSNWRIEACPDHGPGLAVDAQDRLHGVWYAAADGPGLWYGQLQPGSAPENQIKLAGAGASHADVSVHGQQVRVAWLEVGMEGYALRLRTSDDGGLRFGPARTLATSPVAAGSPQWLEHADRAWLGWHTQAGYRLVSIEPTAPEVAGLTAAGVAELLAPPASGARIILLWSLDCVYCKSQMERLAALHRQHPQAVELVTVSTDAFARVEAIVDRLALENMGDFAALAYADPIPERLNHLLDPAWGGELPRTLVLRAGGSRQAASGILDPEYLARLAGLSPPESGN